MRWRWTRRDVSMVLFGACVGLWVSTWLAFIHPLTPFVISYPIGFWSLWIVGSIVAEKHIT